MISFFGLCIENLLTSIKYLLSGRLRYSSLVSQVASISYDSLTLSLIIVLIASSVIAIQVSRQFLLSGADSYIGGTMAIVIIREIAPGFAALAIGARAGTAISAQIANMQVSEQIDAMKTLKVNPVGYYFTPRLLASGITVPMVVIISELVGILGGMFICYFTIDLHPNRYINSVWLWLNTRDVYISIFKASIFGVLISLVCSTEGYNTRGGAREVGYSTTQAAIKSTVYMLLADFVLNLIFYL